MTAAYIAALFVATGGCYFGFDGIEPWDITRDARLYAGPHPVIAHPPCERFGRWAGERAGQDEGCFAAALSATRTYGGVIEHPADSLAWRIHGLTAPSRKGGWIAAGDGIGWTCCVEQGHYGHRARKATWLYAAHVTRPELIWGASEAKIKPRPGRDPVRERRIGAVQRMSRKERRATPPPVPESPNLYRGYRQTMLNADTITDAEIEKLLVELEGSEDYAECVVALHDQPTPPRAVRAARERCAEILNARRTT